MGEAIRRVVARVFFALVKSFVSVGVGDWIVGG